MGATVEQVEQLLNLLREVDLPTLLAFDRKLHLLLGQKEEERLRTQQGTTIQEEFCQRYPHMPIAPDLLALVGVQPENPVEEDKTIIREAIAWRLQNCRSWLTLMMAVYYKAYDAVQLAVALHHCQLLASYQHTVTFVCSDHTLLTAAQAERLRTENPFDHISPHDALESAG